jgi:hypothetical protein
MAFVPGKFFIVWKGKGRERMLWLALVIYLESKVERVALIPKPL